MLIAFDFSELVCGFCVVIRYIDDNDDHNDGDDDDNDDGDVDWLMHGRCECTKLH